MPLHMPVTGSGVRRGGTSYCAGGEELLHRISRNLVEVGTIDSLNGMLKMHNKDKNIQQRYIWVQFRKLHNMRMPLTCRGT